MKKIILTLQKEGPIALIKKVYRRSIYKIKRLVNENEINRVSWKNLEGRYVGKRAFLLGNGPSLNKVPLYLLKNEYTMCFNHFKIMEERINWFPNFYMSTDNLVLDDIINSLNSISEKAELVFLPDIHFRGKNYKKEIKKFKNLFWIEQKHGQGFSNKLPKAYLGGSVIYEGFQVLNYLGFKEIYFIGVDMNFQIHKSANKISGGETDIISIGDDDPNHFDPRYFGKNKKYHQPEDYVINNILKNLKFLSAVAYKFRLSIINAGYDSKVEYFPKVDFQELMNYSEVEKEELFNDCLSQNTRYNSISKLLAYSEELCNIDLFSERLGNFYINEKEGISLISKALISHVPFGPYANRYYFVKRNNTKNS